MSKVFKAFKENCLLRVFLISLFIATCIFLPFIICDRGYFIYYGDFNAQEIPFYKMAHNAVLNGNIFWNIYTDLGANFIGSYSFYMLGSPFFWITLLFPNDFVPYLMGPLLILKMAFSAMFAYIYLKRYVKNEKVLLLGSLLYAFSGFSIYNIFFNHFHEAMVIFPLLLYSLDEFMYKDKKLLFCLITFISCLMNYYFFIGQAVFLIIYFFVKLIKKDYKIDKFKFFILICEFLLGILLSSFLLIPSLLSAAQNPRSSEILVGFDAIIYSLPQRYLHLINSFFFLPDLPAMANFTPNSVAKWASVSAWLPVFSLTGVISYFTLKSSKKNWIKLLILVLFVMSFIPILNSTFQVFNQIFYTRWFYMFILILSLATCLALEELNVESWIKSLKITLAAVLILGLSIGLMPKEFKLSDLSSIKIGLMSNVDIFWIYVAISLLCIFLLFFFFKFYSDKSMIQKSFTSLTVLFIILSSVFMISLGKASFQSKNYSIISSCIEGKNKISLPETQNCRSDAISDFDNLNAFWDIPNIQTFHTVVPGSIMDFYPSVGVERSVNSKPNTSFFGLRGLFSCRWLFRFKEGSFNDNPMPGFKYYNTQNNFDIFENEYYIPYGFTYENYITKAQFEKAPKEKNHLLLLKAVVLEDDQESKYSNLMANLENIENLDYSEDTYFKDCLARKKVCCNSFKYDNYGFTANIDLTNENDKLVFFSVPYEKGWSAKVNGVDTEIEKVNVGFMAVKVPGNKISTIRFNYMTPGLFEGLIISGIALFMILLYAAFLLILKKRHIK